MTSNEVLSMYENIAGMTNQMVIAARTSDWDGLNRLEHACETAAGATDTGVPALADNPRQRKLALLKQILANDRAIRDITEPWMAPVTNAMQATRAQ